MRRIGGATRGTEEEQAERRFDNSHESSIAIPGTQQGTCVCVCIYIYDGKGCHFIEIE